MGGSCSIELTLEGCSRLSAQPKKGAQDLFKVLHAAGGQVLRYYPPSTRVWFDNPDSGGKAVRFVAPPDQALQVHPQPETELDEQDGSVVVPKCFSHELLHRSSFDAEDDEAFLAFAPWADLTFIQQSRSVGLRQLENRKPELLNPVAHGQLALARLLYALLQPKYAWIDEAGANTPGKTIRKTELKYIFWANFFGPAYVEKFGRTFLLEAPGFRKDELDDGGLLYVATESYVEWRRQRPKAILEYFRSEIPGIRLYGAKANCD